MSVASLRVAVVLSLVVSVASEVSLTDYLADHGLSDYSVRLKEIGVEAVGDIAFLSDRDIDSLWRLPVVKRNVLRELSGEMKRERHEERRSEARANRWHKKLLGDIASTIETLLRGFFLGFGLSTAYDCLVVSRDFYTSQEDLVPRVRKVALRASVLGVAVALCMVGSAIVLPTSVRSMWMQDAPRVLGSDI